MAVNLKFNTGFPKKTKGSPQLESWYTRQAFMPDVGLGGFDLGIMADMFLPASYPAKNMPTRYLTVKRQDPVVIPKGKLVTAIQLQNSYTSEDIEVGIASDGTFTTSYDENGDFITADINDYNVYGEDSRFIMSIANATDADVTDKYTILDKGKIGLLSDAGSPPTYTAKIIAEATNGHYVKYDDANLGYIRKSHKPIGFVDAEVYADVRNLYQAFHYDQTFRLRKVGSIAIPYIKADGTIITDADLASGGSGAVYNAVTNMYAFMPILAAGKLNAYDPIAGDADGNYTLDVSSSPFGKLGYAMYYDTVGSKGINWQVATPEGSQTMGTDTFGIATRLYKFIHVISVNAGKSILDLDKLVMSGNIGMAYVYINPLDY